jgi:hypothetical protein
MNSDPKKNEIELPGQKAFPPPMVFAGWCLMCFGLASLFYFVNNGAFIGIILILTGALAALTTECAKIDIGNKKLIFIRRIFNIIPFTYNKDVSQFLRLGIRRASIVSRMFSKSNRILADKNLQYILYFEGEKPGDRTDFAVFNNQKQAYDFLAEIGKKLEMNLIE